MNASASPADIARRNGALSHGPVSAEGKARSAQNATRHGLCARTLVLGAGEDQAELDALCAAMLARHLPLDAAEAHWVDELVFVAWRQRRLRALEDAVLARAGAADAGPPLPSLTTLIRYLGRLDRDWRRAADELATLRRSRTALFDPAQLRALAAGIERGQGGAGAGTAIVQPEQKSTNDLPPAKAYSGTNEPIPPRRNSTNDLAPPAPTLNRHQRRRLAALARLELRHAA